MDEQILSFHSRPTLAVIQSGESRRISLAAFTAAEAIVEPTEALPASIRGHKLYFVGFQCAAANHDEVAARHREFAAIASDISTVWHYVFGCPYLSLDRTTQSQPTPTGWASNRAKVEGALPSSGPRIGGVSTRAFTTYNFPTWPLRALLHVREVFLKMDETNRFLVELHRQALEMQSPAIRLLLLGKMAEVVETLLPGTDRNDKLSRLPAPLQSRLVFGPDVFRLANTRSQTRHAIGDKAAKALHPAMTEREAIDFQSDLDTIARHIVSVQTGLPPAFDESWRFPPNVAVSGPIPVGKKKP